MHVFNPRGGILWLVELITHYLERANAERDDSTRSF